MFFCRDAITHSHPAYMSIAGFWWAAPIFCICCTLHVRPFSTDKIFCSAAVALLLTFLTAAFWACATFVGKAQGLIPTHTLRRSTDKYMIMLLQAWLSLHDHRIKVPFEFRHIDHIGIFCFVQNFLNGVRFSEMACRRMKLSASRLLY